MSKVYVVGVGITKFSKAGEKTDDYPNWVKEAVDKALADATIDYTTIEQAFVGYVYGDSGSGERALHEVGLTGMPIYNITNNCSSSSSALYLAHQLIGNGGGNCMLVVGYEKMMKGKIVQQYTDREYSLAGHIKQMANVAGYDKDLPEIPQLFAKVAQEYMKKYGVSYEYLAKIACKNYKHAMNNPNAQHQKGYTMEQILNSKMIVDPLTVLECSSISDGAAAVIVVSEKFVRKHKLQSKAVEIIGMEMVSDLPSTFNNNSCMKIAGYDCTKEAADRLFTKVNLKRTDVQVMEIHDCFAINELTLYESLGLCSPGKACEFIDIGDNTYGGKYVINPSGGLLGRGHPLGATGLAQTVELCLQLRGEAGKRQVHDAKIGFQHNMGLAAAVVVGLFQKGKFE